jgi:prepilin-type N-terminal cleavage/methylation domain-containing protein
MKHTSSRAFTFIELIIAVTIFAIIAVSIYSTFSAGIKIWLRTSPMIEENQARRVFFNTIALDLKNAVAYYDVSSVLSKPGFGQEYEGKINFTGMPDKISFMTIISISDPDAGLREELARVTYFYDSETKTIKRLVATRLEGLNESSAKPTDMLANVGKKDFGFEYCYKNIISNSDYECEWKDAWEDKNVLKIPRGIRIKLGEARKLVFIPSGSLGEEK